MTPVNRTGLTAEAAAGTCPDLPADRFADRELSWLAFNERVLELAEDRTLPLLERVRFLSIFASNRDEFFMVRVAGLKRRIATGMAVAAASGLHPRHVLEAISATAHELTARHAAVFADDVQPQLARADITLVRFDDLSDSEQNRLHKYFRRNIFPVLTPLAADPPPPLPRPPPPRGRPRSPVPVYLRALAQPRCRRAQPEHRQRTLRPGEGAAALPAVPRRGRPRPAPRPDGDGPRGAVRLLRPHR